MLKTWRISFSVRLIWSCFLIIATNTGMVVVKEIIFDTDEGIRYDAFSEGMAPLKSVFKAKGTVTAGNSSQIGDYV